MILPDTISPGLINQGREHEGQNVYRGNRRQRTQIVQSVYSQGNRAKTTQCQAGWQRVYHFGERLGSLERYSKTKRQTKRYLTEIVSRYILEASLNEIAVRGTPIPNGPTLSKEHRMNHKSTVPAPQFQIASPEQIRAILAKATVYNAAGIAEAAVRLNARALDFAAQLPPVEQQIAMQYVAEAEVAQTGRVAFCRVAREAVRSFWPIGGKRFGAMDYERVRPEQIVRL
jgi:hypothetical protein